MSRPSWGDSIQLCVGTSAPGPSGDWYMTSAMPSHRCYGKMMRMTSLKKKSSTCRYLFPAKRPVNKQETDKVPVACVAPVNPVFSLVEKTVASAFDFFCSIKFDFQYPGCHNNLKSCIRRKGKASVPSALV